MSGAVMAFDVVLWLLLLTMMMTMMMLLLNKLTVFGLYSVLGPYFYHVNPVLSSYWGNVLPCFLCFFFVYHDVAL
jgi:hypothetical protein